MESFVFPHLNSKPLPMKLSHLLIATLISSSIVVSAQTEPKTKQPKSKSKTKTVKQKTKTVCEKNETVVVPNITVKEPRYCPACGRG
ncbi:MAG: hypothetical protein K0S32_3209 [Bacteroidetes bacterium]|jgi:hypothetical protein|nr:hypothetical protein [Bacteroidota bacterium]